MHLQADGASVGEGARCRKEHHLPRCRLNSVVGGRVARARVQLVRIPQLYLLLLHLLPHRRRLCLHPPLLRPLHLPPLRRPSLPRRQLRLLLLLLHVRRLHLSPLVQLVRIPAAVETAGDMVGLRNQPHRQRLPLRLPLRPRRLGRPLRLALERLQLLLLLLHVLPRRRLRLPPLHLRPLHLPPLRLPPRRLFRPGRLQLPSLPLVSLRRRLRLLCILNRLLLIRLALRLFR